VGEVLFLSAATLTHNVERMTASAEGGYLCVDVMNAGTVVLVSGASYSSAALPVATDSTLLIECQITTTNAPLNLRSEPNTSSAILAQLPYNLTLTSSERVQGWYRVNYLNGQGWVSANYVSTIGDCGD
jgi:uncharacterized protein YgiM (DUF1202 family)